MLKGRARIDWHLFLPILVISVLGLTALGSISIKIFSTQLIFLVISLFFFYSFSKFDYKNHLHLLTIYSIFSLALLILPFIFGAVTRGSVRWIQIGSLTLQPSEIIKPFIILVFAAFLTKFKDNLNFKTLIKYLLLFTLPALLIFKQPDLGSTLVVSAIWLGILLASNFPTLTTLSLFGIGIISSPIIWKLLKPYQKLRIASFINPYTDPRGSGYHVIQSTIAVGSGGFWGKGLGHGTQSQLQFLPERHTDFIFASFAEELGLFGSLILIMAFFFLLSHILKIAKQAPDKFSHLITIGVFSMIFFQGIVNIGMNLGMLPITGITLPLVSAGGSSLLATMIGLGIVHNISLNSDSKQSLEIK